MLDFSHRFFKGFLRPLALILPISYIYDIMARTRNLPFTLTLTLFAIASTAWAIEYQPIENESQLISAAENADVFTQYILENDITLTHCVAVKKGKWLDLNFNGKVLNRNLSNGSASDDGCVFHVEEEASLILRNSGNSRGGITGGYATNGGGIYNEGGVMVYGGKISGNKAQDCGGIYNAGGATLLMEGGEISGNISNAGGGGVVNYGTASIRNVTISGNQAATRGGGIWSNGQLTIENSTVSENVIKGEGAASGAGICLRSGANATFTNVIIQNNDAPDQGVGGGIFVERGVRLAINGATISGNKAKNGNGGGGIYTESSISMQGAVDISGNKNMPKNRNYYVDNNLFGLDSTKIILTGAFAAGTHIGLTFSDTRYENMTSGFAANNPDAAPGDFFFGDKEDFVVGLQDGEVLGYNTGTVVITQYVDIDSSIKTVSARKMSAFADKGSHTLQSGWYVVDRDITLEERHYTEGVVNIILTEWGNLDAPKGIGLLEGSKLHIWERTLEYVSRLDAGGDYFLDEETGTIARYECTMDEEVATIGGNGVVNIHGGSVFVFAKGMAPAIGDCDSVTITGGFVRANGDGDATYGGAGIGGRATGIAPDITISGGNVIANGGTRGAGIGSGARGFNHTFAGASYYPAAFKTICISGGTVNADGGFDAAGIGGGAAVHYDPGGLGNEVGDGDFKGLAGNIIITGGIVYARSGFGLKAYAKDDDDAEAIGHGLLRNGQGVTHGEYFVYDNAKVSATNDINSFDYVPMDANSRTDAFKYVKVVIEPCDHAGSVINTFADEHDGHHSVGCEYCKAKREAHTFGDDGICTKCGVSDAAYTVTLAQALSKTPNGTYGSENITLLKGQTQYTLPSVSVTPTDYEFAGWYMGNINDIVTDGYHLKSTIENPSLYEPGKTVDVNANTEIIAVYRLLNSGALTIAYNETIAEATINGYYTGVDVVNIPNDIKVDTVAFTRAFENGVASTIVLPFSITTDNVEGANFYDITGVTKDANGKWSSVGTRRLGKEGVETIVANKPYLVKLKTGAEKLIFRGEVTLNTSVKQPYAVNGGLWSFRGAYKTFAVGDTASLVGSTYGFTTNAQDGYDKGVFAKGASDARIPAMRCYLVYTGTSAPQANNRPRMNFRPTMVSDIALETIDVEFDDGEEGTTVIGKLDMATGEIRMAPRTADRWFDIQGRVLNGKPTIKGRYIHNGKLVIIK